MPTTDGLQTKINNIADFVEYRNGDASLIVKKNNANRNRD